MERTESRSKAVAQSLWRLRAWSEERLHIQNSIIRWDVLLALASTEDGSLLYGELDAMVGRSPRAMQYVLRDLQEVGLVSMSKATHDRRCVRISLTGRARVEIEEMADLVESMLACEMSSASN